MKRKASKLLLERILVPVLGTHWHWILCKAALHSNQLGLL